jgi:hypothetical protein
MTYHAVISAFLLVQSVSRTHNRKGDQWCRYIFLSGEHEEEQWDYRHTLVKQYSIGVYTARV